MRRDRFVAAYNEAVKIETSGEGKATLFIGAEQWPFPFPLLKTATGWRFDVKSGAEEILNRRIGRNERSAIQVCLAYVDGQREYATKDRDDNGLLEYARKLDQHARQAGRPVLGRWRRRAHEPTRPAVDAGRAARLPGPRRSPIITVTTIEF